MTHIPLLNNNETLFITQLNQLEPSGTPAAAAHAHLFLPAKFSAALWRLRGVVHKSSVVHPVRSPTDPLCPPRTDTPFLSLTTQPAFHFFFFFCGAGAWRPPPSEQEGL